MVIEQLKSVAIFEIVLPECCPTFWKFGKSRLFSNPCKIGTNENKRARSLENPRLLPSLTTGNFYGLLPKSNQHKKLEMLCTEMYLRFESVTLRQNATASRETCRFSYWLFSLSLSSAAISNFPRDVFSTQAIDAAVDLFESKPKCA